MKKQLAFLLALGLSFTMFAGCGKKDNKQDTDTGTEQTTESDTTDTGSDTGTDTESDTTSDTETDTESEHTHDYDELGNCKYCEESLSSELELVSNVYNATIQDGKIYFYFTAICGQKGFYVDLCQIGDYSEHPEDAPNLITSMEVYKEGTTENLVTADNYDTQLDCDYWYYSSNFNYEVGKTYYVVLNFVDTYEEENIALYVDVAGLRHNYDHYGKCLGCDLDLGYAMTSNYDGSVFTYEETEAVETDEFGYAYFTANLEATKYTLKINGEPYDSTKFNASLYTINGNTSSGYGFDKAKGCFTLGKEGKFGLNVKAKDDNENPEIYSVELTVATGIKAEPNYGSYTGTSNVIVGRGTVLNVVIKKGTFTNTRNITLVKEDGTTVVFKGEIAGLEIDKTMVESAEAGQTVGVLIRGLDEVDLTQVKYIICE